MPRAPRRLSAWPTVPSSVTSMTAPRSSSAFHARLCGRASPLTHQREERLIEGRCRLPSRTHIHLDAVLAELLEATTTDQRIRIADRGDNAGDSRTDDSFDAGAGPPLVAARLQRGIQRRPA